MRDAFAANFSGLARIREALSPDPVLTQYETDYRWLAQVYESPKPSTGTSRLLSHRLGAKTIELTHKSVYVDAVRDDLDTLVLDAGFLKALLGNPDLEKKAKEILVKLAGHLRKHARNPKFKALSDRLKDLTNRHQQGLLLSIDFLKELRALAKEVVKTERETSEEDDIEEIVQVVRCDDWQGMHAGEREVKKALRQTLFQYKRHQDAELF
jgi:type I restriction enzyme R subunit